MEKGCNPYYLVDPTTHYGKLDGLMTRLIGYCALVAALAPAIAHAQSTQPPQRQQTSGGTTTDEEIRPAVTTVAGDTGIWFVPTAGVLSHKKWSLSLYRTNVDDGQGFSDISTFPVTFAVGLGNRAEIFGNWSLVTRIDRDTRPLFFHSTTQEADTGTGGGILVSHPFVRDQWTGNKLGDLSLGTKVSLFSAPSKPVGVAARLQIKLPTGDKDAGGSSGKADVIVDGVVSSFSSALDFSGYGGVIMRGSPDGYQLTNGLRWGIGAAFPQKFSLGFRLTAELFGEKYFDRTITAPAGQLGADLSLVPTSTSIKDPVIGLLGITWQAPKGFFVGVAASWNLNMSPRSEARFTCAPGFVCPAVVTEFIDTPKDDKGLQVRIGFHPGARRHGPRPAEPAPVVAKPEPPQKPQPPVTPLAPANRPPTVTAACDPCTVEVGRTATVSATAQDPDGDALTYLWTAAAGTLTTTTARQTPWTAPMQEGAVLFTVTVNDGKGGTARATTTINVVRPVVREITFEDVHFDFDRFTLRADALKVLDQAVAAMQANPNLRLTLEGHTCNIGTAEYNLALGERRAHAVRDYLTSRGIAAARLTTVSYGEERPKHDNSREETRRLNRRAALVVRLQ